MGYVTTHPLTISQCKQQQTLYRMSVQFPPILSIFLTSIQHLGPAPSDAGAEYKGRGDGSTMKALAWFGAEDVRVIDAPVPDITEPNDVILEVTGSTICGSDLHLYHGEIMALQKGDILGHEFMGKVEKVGPNVTNLKPGQRVVASFQIACGTCRYCKQKLSSFCDNTNSSS